MQDKLQDRPEEKKRQTNGEWLVKNLKPFGCVLVLVCMVLMIALCLTSGRDPIKGYEPPHTSEYYSEHLDELKEELEANVFPNVQGVTGCEMSEGALSVTIASDSFVTTRSAILRYYDESLFELIRQEP